MGVLHSLMLEPSVPGPEPEGTIAVASKPNSGLIVPQLQSTKGFVQSCRTWHGLEAKRRVVWRQNNSEGRLIEIWNSEKVCSVGFWL